MLLSRLDNGMEVALLPDLSPGAPDVAAVYCWLDVGSADEPAGLEGAAHFIEHLVFKGTQSYGVGEVAAAVESVGGDLNAWTSFEETVFHATVPAAGVETTVAVLAEMLRKPTFNADEIERERKVVLEEIRGGDDDPDSVVSEATWGVCFPGQPYGRPVIGSMESVGELPRARLLEFHARHYMPANGRVVVVGRFDVEAVRASVARHFSGGPPRPPRAQRPVRAGGPGCTIIRRRFDTRVVRLAFPAPGHRDEAAPVYDVLAAALAGGSGTPLVDALMAKPGVHGVSVDYEAEAEGGILVAEAYVGPGYVRPALDWLSGLLAELAGGEIAAADVARAKASLAAQRVARHQSVDGRATDAAFSLSHHGNLEAWRVYDARIAAVDVVEVRELARRVFDAATARIVALAPGTRSLAPSWAPRPARRVPAGILVERLPNGAKIMVERDESALASVRIVGMGGQLAERRELAGCGVLWMNSIARGAGGLSRGALGRALSNLAASISASGGRSSQALRLDAPAQSLTSALEFLLCVLSTPHFDEAEVDLAREGVLDQLASRDDDAESRLASAMAEVAFPSHPWGLDFLGTVESLTAVRPDVLRSAHRSWARPENLVVSVVGDVDVEATVGRLRHALSTLPAGGEPAAFSRVVHPRGTRRVKLTSARDQAHVSMLFPGLSVRDPRGGALDLLIEVLSSQSGRLFTELREQRGLAYQVGAASVDGPFGGVISAGLSTHPARAVEAEQSLATSLATIAAGNIDDAEVERARAALLGGAEANLQSVGSRASQLAYSERYGLDGRKYRDIARRSANVGADEVRAVAATLLRRATVVGRIGGQE